MTETYVTIEEAAKLENINYFALWKRINRNKESYKTKKLPSMDGGKDRILLSTDSLSSKAKRVYKATAVQKEDIEDTPWYVYADYNWYKTKYPEYFFKGVELSKYINEYLNFIPNKKEGKTK
ncbi:MAG: transposase, partial [Vallitalea sp.]|nr:transposase [Vallitalea sp.]